MKRSRRIWAVPFGVLLGLFFAASGCSSGGSAGSFTCSGACTCSATDCTCDKGGTCFLGPQTPAVDGSVGSGGAPLPNGVDYHCESKNQCTLACGVGCTSKCAGGSACNGSCDSNCNFTCDGSSRCSLATGTNSAVTCSGNSGCSLSVDTGTVVSCQGNTTCDIRCPRGGCTASCTGSSTCTVHCGGLVPCHVECNGESGADCPPGKVCTGLCGSDATITPIDAGPPPPP